MPDPSELDQRSRRGNECVWWSWGLHQPGRYFGGLSRKRGATPQSSRGPRARRGSVGIVTAADQIDINYAELAMSKTRNKQIRDFAQQMITDHSSIQHSVNDHGSWLELFHA